MSAVGSPKVLRFRGLSLLWSSRSMILLAVFALLILGFAMLGLTLGKAGLGLDQVWAAITGESSAMIRKVVLEWRAPRIVAAVLFGAALGISGTLFQSLVRNPLASPDIIGFNTGAFTGVIVVMLLGGSSFAAMSLGALSGGLLTAAVIYVLAFRRGVRGFRFIIVGIAASAFLSSLNTWFSVNVDLDTALRAASWGAGTLQLVSWEQLLLSSLVILLISMFLPLISRWLRQLQMGDEVAAMAGVPVEKAKVVIIVIGVALTAVVTAAAGPIAFVALVAPHIARRLWRQHSALGLLGSAAVGALLLLVSDLLAQHALSGVTLPVGAVTICLGGLYLVWLPLREVERK
ncbi:iron ABC transporter permease [Psychromicrobium lacuslunae]|uniref:Iron ABC transporter permease n=1 Tax=Psychromicrobium lacuslunae TaxID=1618207 RepID=A0A0D4C0U6_9MICC|nr:iron ABC transporter permease [Psychromicrobium lacuslunae]